MAFMCCVILAACTGLIEPAPEVAARPVYRITGTSVRDVRARQEVPKVQTMRRGEDNTP
jgi:hypothetical protein